MSDFAQFLTDLGLRPRRAVEPDGRWYRCPTEAHPKSTNGAYRLAPDGGCGWAQDWAIHPEPVVWRPERTSAPSTQAVDFGAIRRRQEEERRERERATKGAAEFYRRCRPLIGGHEYLTAKGLDMTGCRGLRVDGDGRLVVPMGRAGQLLSVQRIAADGDKRFWPGAPTTGASYTIDRKGAALTILCEGLATGLALYAAVAFSRVVVAFNAGNLPKVAAQLPRQGMACVAADNDHGTAERIGRNPGVVLATEAAALLGCRVAVPEGMEGTDWLDFRNERVAARLDAPVYGRRRETEGTVRRAVDAEIARLIRQAAAFLPVSA